MRRADRIRCALRGSALHARQPHAALGGACLHHPLLLLLAPCPTHRHAPGPPTLVARRRLSLTAERWEDDSPAVLLRLAVAELVAHRLRYLRLVCEPGPRAVVSAGGGAANARPCIAARKFVH